MCLRRDRGRSIIIRASTIVNESRDCGSSSASHEMPLDADNCELLRLFKDFPIFLEKGARKSDGVKSRLFIRMERKLYAFLVAS